MYDDVKTILRRFGELRKQIMLYAKKPSSKFNRDSCDNLAVNGDRHSSIFQGCGGLAQRLQSAAPAPKARERPGKSIVSVSRPLKRASKSM